MEEQKKKRQRLSGRRYNLYLKKKVPLDHAPNSSKWHVSQKEQAHTDMSLCDENVPQGTCTEEIQSISEEGIENVASSLDVRIISFEELPNKPNDVVDESLTDKPFINSGDEENVISPESEELPRLDVLSENDIEFGDFDEILNIYEADHENVLNNDEQQECDLETADENINTHSTDGDNVVFPGSPLKLGASMLLIMTFALKYSLTGEGLSDLLNLISLHCPVENLLAQSVGSFKKWFQHIKHPLKIHKYCSFCNLLVSEMDLIQRVCPNMKCGKSISQESISHFIEIPIAEQVKSFFARPSFLADIEHRFNRKKKSASSIDDIYDGNVYKSLVQEGILSNPYNLSLLWNTDGIPCFKSSNVSLWPLFFQINELQYSKRCCPENMLLGGLWFGPKKPTMMSYTEPFVNSLKSLETEGVQIKRNNVSFTCKVVVIGGTADLPARCVVCNTVQFNGKFGCCKCLQPGETCKVSARGHCHIFPFKPDNPDGPKRSHDENQIDVINAVQNNVPSRGVKGPSFLQCLSFYNMVSGTCIDYMHGVLLGVTKLLLSLWFSSEHSGQLFSLYTSVDLVDKRLRWLKPPNTITRLPRSIKDHLKYWKASELRSWLLYYSLPILRDIQNSDYFQHYLLFVNAVYLLLQDSISADDIERSRSILIHFCCMFAALYGDRYMTCNIHQLLHLSDMVNDMGPLWAYSCFSFENANGTLLKLFNGTQNVDFQIVEAVNLNQNLPNLKKKFLMPGSPELSLYESMKGDLKRKDTHLNDNIYIVGGRGKANLKKTEMDAVSQFLGHVPMHYCSFNRIRIGGEIYHSKKYMRVHARNSFTIAYQDFEEVKFCQVAFYLQLYPFCEKHGQVSYTCRCHVANVAVGVPMPKNNNYGTFSTDELTKADVSFINVLHSPNIENNHLCIVPLQNILYKCVFIEIKDNADAVFACKMPNTIEKD